MSHKLKVGELQVSYLTDEEIWRIFTVVLSTKAKKSSTYKYALVKAIIENLYQLNDDYEISYDQLAYSFAKIYWNLVVHHKLVWQNHGSKNAAVVRIIKDIQGQHHTPAEYSFDKISAEIQVKLVQQVKVTMKANVFGALYGDTRGSFYAFDHRREYFRLNPPVHAFMLNYQRLLVNLTNYHMAMMIEELNEVPSINYLLGKVECIAKRSSLSIFERILLDYFENTCFYCGKNLSDGKRQTHVDHFIPWSFVQSDNIWNLVLSCSTCNTSKSDKLPEREYLDIIMERNEELHERAKGQVLADMMTNYKDKKIILLYDYSIKNGFDTMWSPK